jgi:transposase
MKSKKRKNYTKSFKEEAVKLITNGGYSFAEAGRNLGVNPNLISRWKRELDGGGSEMGAEQMVSLQAELKDLRKANKRLTMEREILKKAAAFFAKESG